MNYYLIFFGMLILNVPSIGLFDCVPDFVGAVLLAFAFRDFALLTDKADRANKFLWATAAVSGVKTALYYLYIMPNGIKSGNLYLLFQFLFFVSEAILLVGTFNSCFSTLDFLKMRYGTDKTASRKGSDTSKLLSFVGIYTVGRLALGILPDFFALSAENSVKNVETLVSFLRIFAVVISFVAFFVLTLFQFENIKYFKSDKVLPQSLKERLDSYVKEDARAYASAKLKSAYFAFTVAVIASCRLCIDGSDVIPKVIPAVLFAFAAAIVPGGKRLKIFGFASSACLAVSSVFCLAVSREYFADFTAESSLWSDSAKSLYTVLSISQLSECVFILLNALVTAELIRKFCVEALRTVTDTENGKKALVTVNRNMRFFSVTAVLCLSISAISGFLVPYFGVFDMISAVSGAALAVTAYFAEPKIGR